MPRTLPQALGFVLGLWLAITLVQPIAASGQSLSAGADPALDALEADLYVRVNALREQHHLIALRRDPALDAVARAHSQDMATRGYFSHDTPEGVNPVGRLERAGVTGFTLAGENVGLTSRSRPNHEILTGWIQSPVHRDNLVAPVFNTTGLGVARAAGGTLYYTQLYATIPRSAGAK